MFSTYPSLRAGSFFLGGGGKIKPPPPHSFSLFIFPFLPKNMSRLAGYTYPQRHHVFTTFKFLNIKFLGFQIQPQNSCKKVSYKITRVCANQFHISDCAKSILPQPWCKTKAWLLSEAVNRAIRRNNKWLK